MKVKVADRLPSYYDWKNMRFIVGQQQERVKTVGSMRDIVSEIIDRKLWYAKQKDGTFECEIYADYRDEMDQKTAGEICSSNDPWLDLSEKVQEWYFEVECQYRNDLLEEVRKELEDENGPYSSGLGGMEDEFESAIEELVYWKYPEDHFLNQDFFVNIMLDTGDGNYDYTLNSPYPCWYGQYEARLDEKSSLLWLSRQQGYTKTKLWNALRDGDVADSKGFLESCRHEVANLPSHMATLTFLVRMTLRELIELNRCIKLQDRNGHFYDATQNPYCGYIVLGKETMTGLFDPWCGGGSVLEIELEKDVRIPIRFIRSALPDGCDGYSVNDVYALCRSAWRETVKKIHAPKNINDLEAKAG